MTNIFIKTLAQNLVKKLFPDTLGQSIASSFHCIRKGSLPLRISSVNVTKYSVSCGFSHIYCKKPKWKTSVFCAVFFKMRTLPILKLICCKPLAFNSYKTFFKNKKRSGTSLPASFSA